jgi:hypothetical protein
MRGSKWGGANEGEQSNSKARLSVVVVVGLSARSRIPRPPNIYPKSNQQQQQRQEEFQSEGGAGMNHEAKSREGENWMKIKWRETKYQILIITN